MELKMTIKGLDGFMDGLKKSPEFTVSELNKAITRTVGLVQNQAIKEAPVNKQAMGGNLRQMIRSRMTNRLSGEVSADAKYSIFVHEGTRPHEIRAVNRKVLANKRLGEFYGKVVRHPGTKPNRFLQRAVEIVTPRANQLFETALNNVLNKIASMAK